MHLQTHDIYALMNVTLLAHLPLTSYCTRYSTRYIRIAKVALIVGDRFESWFAPNLRDFAFTQRTERNGTPYARLWGRIDISDLAFGACRVTPSPQP